MKMELGIMAAVALAGGAYLAFDAGGPEVRDGYARSDIFAQCDLDYLQSARHLGFSASARECECFDDKLQQLSPSQQRAAYKSLEDRLTLAFMAKAGAEVQASNVRYEDDVFGEVDADVVIETSGSAIMQQCEMF